MKMKNLHTLHWEGTLVIDGGWGPKNDVRNWAAEGQVDLIPLLEVPHDLFDRALKSAHTESPQSAVVKVLGYQVSCSGQSFIALSQYLRQLAQQGRTIWCELTEKWEDFRPGQDVRRAVLESTKDQQLMISVYFAQWEPVFTSKYGADLVQMVEEEQCGETVH